MQKAVAIVPISANKKTGYVAATYASQSSCPSSCPLFKQGCYAETGHVGIQTHRLNKSLIIDQTEIAQIEAKGIRSLKGGIPLRVHVVGDCATNESASIVSQAMIEYKGNAWTYTHAWRDVDHSSWNGAAVLASCESTEDVKAASAKGYATALIVDKHDSDNAYIRDGIKIIPCPEQTKGVQCNSCKLCFKPQNLKGTIGFAAHGIQVKKVKAALDKNGAKG